MKDKFQALYQKKTGKIKPGLERILHAAHLLNLDLKSTPSVLLGGTNGKGSTSTYLANFLSGKYKRVGLYTSPHLINFRERIQVSNIEVTDELLIENLSEIEHKLNNLIYDELSFFEITTLLGFFIFQKFKTDFNVIEVGMGGRWDATNIIHPLASIITTIGMDHMEYLGDDLGKIFFEKLGIARQGRPLFLGFDPMQSDEKIKTVWEKFLENKKTNNLIFDEKTEDDISYLPPYLRHNYFLARKVYEYLLNENPIFKHTFNLRGRFEEVQLKSGRKIICDVCHNLEGLHAFLSALEQHVGSKTMRELTVFYTGMKDKPFLKILESLNEKFARVLVFKNRSERTIEKDDVQEKFFNSWQALLEYSLAKNIKSPWIVCGSVLGLGEVIEMENKF